MITAGQQIAAQANANKNKDVFGSIIYNIKAYGAKGNGIADDTANIRSAIDDASEGSTIWLPDGDYKVTSMITVNKRLRFMGSGSLHSYIPSGSTSEVYNNLNYIFKANADYCSFEGLRFENPNSYVATGAIWYNANYVSVTGCHIDNFTQPLVGGLNCTGFRAKENFVTNVIGVASENIGDGILSFASQSVMSGNYVTVKALTDGRTGICVDLTGRESVISDNTVNGFRRCIHVEYSNRTVVDSNICMGTSSRGIYVFSDTVVVSNNIVQSAADDIDPNGDICVAIGTFGSNYVQIIGNNIFAGGSSVGRGISTDGTQHVISENTFQGGADAFSDLLYIGGSNNTISKNRMQSGCVSGRGINALNASYLIVTENYFEECGVHGIDLNNCKYSNIQNNYCLNNVNYGIVIQGASDFATITGNRSFDNRVSKTQAYGIYVNTSNNALIDGNHLAGNLTAPISIDAGSQSTAFVSNNQGLNPVGQLTAPAVPATTVAQTNSFPYQIRVFIIGGTVTAVSINGVAVGNPSMVVLGRGESITLTYSSAPTWKWFGL